MRTVWIVGVLLCAVGCSTTPPSRLHVGALDGDVAFFLAGHPLAPDQAIRADTVARSDGASYHVVQVRTRESPHVHATHDLEVHVLRGGGTFHVGERTIALHAGDVVVVPRGTPHWFAADPREVSAAFVTFTPPLDAPDQIPVHE